MPKIMLVEDDATMISLLQTLLMMEGFQVVMMKEENIGAILNQLKDENPDLALVDVNLRQVYGFDLLREIRKDSLLKDLHVIMSSGMDYSSECLQAGADDFILKPYMPDDLIRLIRQNIQRERK